MTGDERRELIAGHDRLARYIAWRTRRRYPGVDLDDLLSEVRLAFTRAAAAYDPALGRFASYAWPAGVRAAAAYARREAFRRAEPLVAEPAAAEPDDSPGRDGQFWEAAAAGLGPRDRRILLGLYRDGRSRTEVARETGQSPDRVRSAEELILRKLRRDGRLDQYRG